MDFHFTSKAVNYHLMRAVALLASSELDYTSQALIEADTALGIAQEAVKHGENAYNLECKSQFYRGLCLIEMKKWREANWALTRAACIESWAEQVGNLGRECRLRLLEETRSKKKTVNL